MASTYPCIKTNKILKDIFRFSKLRNRGRQFFILKFDSAELYTSRAILCSGLLLTPAGKHELV
jgi:hypothetical protein